MVKLQVILIKFVDAASFYWIKKVKSIEEHFLNTMPLLISLANKRVSRLQIILKFKMYYKIIYREKAINSLIKTNKAKVSTLLDLLINLLPIL